MDYEKAYNDLVSFIEVLSHSAISQDQHKLIDSILNNYITPQKSRESIKKQLLWLCDEWEFHSEHRTVPADEDNIREIREWVQKQEPEQTEEEQQYIATLHNLISDWRIGKREYDREYYDDIERWLDSRHVEPVKNIAVNNNIGDVLAKYFESQSEHYLFCGFTRDEICAWINSKQWKPTKEQVDAVKNSAYGMYVNGDGPVLRELYQQLKKLF